MDKGILRDLALETFHRSPETQFENLKRAVAELAVERGLLGAANTRGLRISYPTEPQLPVQDQDLLQEVVWDLIIERVLTPGINALNAEWPWLRMTEHGKQIVSQELGENL